MYFQSNSTPLAPNQRGRRRVATSSEVPQPTKTVHSNRCKPEWKLMATRESNKIHSQLSKKCPQAHNEAVKYYHNEASHKYPHSEMPSQCSNKTSDKRAEILFPLKYDGNFLTASTPEILLHVSRQGMMRKMAQLTHSSCCHLHLSLAR